MYSSYPTVESVDAVLDRAAESSLPLIVGEFGHRLNGVDVAWQQILEKCQQLGLGYIAWSWTGNDAQTEHLDLVEDWGGALTAWGEDVMNGPGGIRETATPASLFE
jgi:mannan endo-1,4-beta-mannosidase